MTYYVYAKRRHKIEPFYDEKGVLVYNGDKKEITVLSYFNDRKLAQIFCDNIKKNVSEENWKIWVHGKRPEKEIDIPKNS